MIRFLQQKDSRITKAIFAVIIAVVSVGMVVYLIPGLMGMGASSTDAYATIYPHWYNRLFSSGATVSQLKVSQMARRELQRQNPQYADNPAIVEMFEPRVGQQLIQQKVLLAEAAKLGIRASNDDLIQFLHKGQFGQYLFPNGQFIGDDRYAALIANQFNMSVAEFEDAVREEIVIQRMQSLVTAGATVGDTEAKESYRKQNIKIKFDYAVISAEDLKNQLNPTDGELEAFFKKNAARYATAMPEERKITYFSFSMQDIRGDLKPPTQAEIQQYFTAHQSEYSVPDQSRSRHILIKVAQGADAATDAAAKTKAEGLLKQIQSGANFADLAAKNSDDLGSKDRGGELGFAKHGMMVPEFDKAIFGQKIGDTAIVKSQFGYHIVQVEERQPAHAQTLNEVLLPIQMTLFRQKAQKAQQDFAQSLTSEAIKNGLEKTAAAHHYQLVTTPSIGAHGVIASLPNGSQIVSKAFEAKQGDPPQYAQTGEGYAIFQVTGVTAAHAPSFADWKSHVSDDYRQEQLPVLLTQKTKDLADKAKSENDLAKAAKELGATLKNSDLVAPTGQVPDIGQVQQSAPQLLDLKVGDVSGPITSARSGVVAKLVDRQEPSADEIAKNFGTVHDKMLDERRSQAFSVFMSSLMDDYKKHKRIVMNAKAKNSKIPGL